MKKPFLFLLSILACQTAHADIILLKNGQVIEGKVIPVRDIYIKVMSYSGKSSKIFLIENIARIEQSEEGGASDDIIQKMRQQALIEGTIQNEGYGVVNIPFDENSRAVREEAVKIMETPKPEEGVSVMESVAAAAASDVTGVKEWIPPHYFGSLLPFTIDLRNWWFTLPDLTFTARDHMIGVLLILLLGILLREKINNRRKSEMISSSLEDLERELEIFEQETSKRKRKRPRFEKRKCPRVDTDLPISLVLDKVIPIAAIVRNISLSGAYALCNDLKLLSLGDQCQFALGPNMNDPSFSVHGKAKVVRIRSGHGVGLQFSGLDQKSLRSLGRFMG
jgi:hypothetical protein